MTSTLIHTSFNTCFARYARCWNNMLPVITGGVSQPTVPDVTDAAYSTSTDGSPASGDANQNGARVRKIFVKSVGNHCSSAPLLLGLVTFFKRQLPDVGFFRPIVELPFVSGIPRFVRLLKDVGGIPDNERDMYAVTEETAYQMMADGKHKELFATVYRAYSKYEGKHDLIVFNGWRDGGAAINAELAAYFDAPVVLVLNYHPGERSASAYERAMAEVNEYRLHKATVMAVLVNKVPSDEYDSLHLELRQRFQDAGVGFAGMMPIIPKLQTIRLDQVYQDLGCKLLSSAEAQVNLDSPVNAVHVAVEECGSLLCKLSKLDRPLVITTPGRIDVTAVCASAHMSGSVPLSGIMIAEHDNSDSEPIKQLQKILDGLERQQGDGIRLPVFTTSKTVLEAAQGLQAIQPTILSTSLAKIDHVHQAFDQYVDTDVLTEGIESFQEHLTPSKFIYDIKQRCRDHPQSIVLPESEDHRVLTAASQATRKGLAKITLIGDSTLVHQEAGKLGLDMTGIDVIDHLTSPLMDTFADDLVVIRKKKNLSRDSALDQLKDPCTFGTMMVRSGQMDGLVSGAAHTTANTIRPAMRVLKNPKMPLISSIFFMCLPDTVLVYGDCAVNVDPDAQQLAYIALASAETAAAFGIEPRVAMLSYSTLGSGSGPEVDKIVEAVRIVRNMDPTLLVTGPIQYDAATNERIAAVKVKEKTDTVAGRANVLIFPDLNAGNNTYKAVQQASGAVAMGPIMQGLAKPVNDLSRGCTVPDILDTICATSLQAIFKKDIS